MPIAYKGFHAYYVDPDTYENVAFIGDYVITFIDKGSSPQQVTFENLSTTVQYMSSAGFPTGDILSFAPAISDIDDLCLNHLRMVIPGIVRFPGNGTGRTCRIKLLSLEGSYAISETVGNNTAPTSLINWMLFNKKGEFISTYSWGIIRDSRFTTWCSQPGFDGTLTDAPFYVWRLSVQDFLTEKYTCTAESGGTTDRAKFVAWINNIGPLVPPDPYEPGGTSGPGGGTDGTFDFTSTDVPIPPLPGIGAVNTGFLTLYKPTAGELQSTAQYMWSGAFDPENLRKLFANPMDAILGLHIVPTASGHPAAASSTLQIGNISTGLSMARVTEQYYELDCGTITISPKWGAYLDYSPYSKLSLYLPYIGIVPISPDDCMGGNIRVVYHVDILSGSCCVYVYCTSNRGTDGHTLYTFTGACACDCPVTEGQYTNAVLGILGIAGGVAGAISSGAVGNAGGVTGGLAEAASAALSMVKPDIGRSGNFGGSAGLMGIQYPFLILTIPKMCTPGDQQIYRGYPSFVTMELSELSGYAEIEITHISNMPATAAEVDELRTILEGGVIF